LTYERIGSELSVAGIADDPSLKNPISAKVASGGRRSSKAQRSTTVDAGDELGSAMRIE
jgi:hypothetical protein